MGSWKVGLRGMILLAVCLAALLQPALSGPLMAVDLGSESFKVSVVRPGKVPISIVTNEMSKRRTSAQVAFLNGDRLLGEEAAALSIRYPDRVFARARDLLGKPAGHPTVAALLQDNLLPYTVVEDERKTVRLALPGGESYSAEELVGSLLHYAKQLTEAASGGQEVLDCVVSVPAWFDQAQRQGLLDAAELAGLNVLGLINSHAAAALQYGIARDFSNSSETVVLYDMGAGSVEAALVHFSSFTVREAGKAKTYSQFEVKDVAWAEEVGAGKLDLTLLKHFAARFQEKHGKNPLEHPRAVAKLKRQVKRTKEILSANSAAPFSVEELLDGVDFRDSITRDEFEALAAPLVAAAAAPLAHLLERNQVAPGDLAAVELLGGGSRIPAVKAALSEVLGSRGLDMHLDADEAVVMGAGLFAANLSTTFRLRKFGMSDGLVYPINFLLEKGGADDSPETPADSDAAADGDSEPVAGAAFKPKALLPRLKRLPAQRVVHLPTSTADPVRFSLSYDESQPLPRGAPGPLLAEFEVTGLAGVAAKYGETGKKSVHFRAGPSGVLKVDKAEAVLNLVETVEVKVPKKVPIPNITLEEPPANASADSQEGGAAADAKGAEGSATRNLTEAEPEFETVTKEKKKVVRVPLPVGGRGFLLPGLSKSALRASKRVLEEFEKKAEAKRAAGKAKNDLEAYLIATGGQLDSDEELAQVTLESEREAFRAQLAEVEDWLYMEGADEAAAVFREKLAQLKKVGDPMYFRKAELAARPAAVEDAKKLLGLVAKAANVWETAKPWINATDRQDLLAKVVEAEAWLDTQVKAQAKLASHKEPVLRSEDIELRLAPLRKQFTKLNNRKKPKPPPAPANETTAGAANATANATAEETDAVAEGSEEYDHTEL